jgi:hypothetical protein
MFSCQQNQRRRGQNRFYLEAGGHGVGRQRGEVAQTICTHVSKYKNDEIKEKKRKYL